MDDHTLYRDSRYEFVRVCLTHGGLYDTRSDSDTGYRQSCHDRTGQPRWEGFDFNEWIHLCDCCLSESIPSGSRWSSFFCLTCRTALRDAGVGIPIGRHSLMNRLGISTDDAEGFVSALGTMKEAIDRLKLWKIEQLMGLDTTEESLYLDEVYDLTYEDTDTAVERLLAWWVGDDREYIFSVSPRMMFAKWKAEHEAREAEGS